MGVNDQVGAPAEDRSAERVGPVGPVERVGPVGPVGPVERVGPVGPVVAVVLAGAGARGAYEAGVLSVLLPALEAEGTAPQIFIGTSAGAINAAGFCALSHLGARDASDQVLRFWREIGVRDVLRVPLRGVLTAIWRRSYGGRQDRPSGLVDTGPLAATLGRLIDWRRLHENLRTRDLTLGVVVTACSTRRTSVFVERRTPVPTMSDDERAIDYLGTTVRVDHVMASSALPALFPPIELRHPPGNLDWSLDGGIRLNTPVKPALTLGANRVVVVATSSAAYAPTGKGFQQPPPGIAGGVAQLLHALLVDRMIEDLRTLETKNRRATEEGAGSAYQVIPWIFAGPSISDPDPVGQLVGDVFADMTGLARIVARPLGRWLSRDPQRGEILSYLFFHPAFLDRAIRLGRADAARCLNPDRTPDWHTSESVASVASAHRTPEATEGR
ncbi:MAG: hypothetical protein QOG44_2561 [Acidimicrobiaceae bacterium]|nr:hypothetical protein [Acidimicrobiaceae bacterium]